ncbi:MAG: alpha-ketoacid dehydrogenase subunit beta, partial [Bhargavaea sp.]
MAERKVTFMTAINEAMYQAMKKDDTVILIGTDVAGGAEVDHLIQDDGRHDDAFGGVFGLSKGLVTEFGRGR